MDYKIEILEDEHKLKVTTKFDVSYSDVNKIEGVEECDHLTRYTFKLTVGEMFTMEEVVKNIQNYIDARNGNYQRLKNRNRITDESKTEIDVSDDFPLERMIKTFKGELYGKEEKRNWWTFIKNLWKGENGKKVSVKWPL
jgi:hypothetical protein